MLDGWRGWRASASITVSGCRKAFSNATSPGEAFGEMWKRLGDAIDPETDTLLAYPLCHACRRMGVAIGGPPPQPSSGLFLF